MNFTQCVQFLKAVQKHSTLNIHFCSQIWFIYLKVSIMLNWREFIIKYQSLQDEFIFCQQYGTSQSEVQLQQNYTQETNKYATIIVFERYISDTNTIFLYGYDSNSLIIFKQQHYKVDKLITNLHQYLVEVKDFLQQILTQNQEICIHFINYASILESDKLKIKQEAYKLLELPFPKSKIVLWMELQTSLQIPNDYLQIQISFNQLALLKIERNMIQNLELYQQFTLKQITSIQEIHKQFLLQLELCESQVEAFKLQSLIKDITYVKEIPKQKEYLAQFLMNLPRFTCQETVIMIAKLKLYKQNVILKKIVNQQKLSVKEYIEVAKTDLSIFKEEKNCHFPIKGDNSQKCKVCQKNNRKVRKSSFICKACQEHYKINVTLCTTKCFKLFHLNPERYLRRKSRTKTAKIEE